MSAPRTIDPDVFSEEERRRLQQHLAALKHRGPEERGGRLQVEGHREEVALPDAVTTALIEMLTDLTEGRAVSIASADDELTTREAADLLNVSRPHLVKLLEEGAITFHKVGTHRRVRRRDVLAYKAKQRAEAEDALQQLADQAQQLGLGY